MVAPALRHRPLLDEPRDRDERRVEDRDREHEQREEHRRDGRSRDGPAGSERERGEAEAEHLAPGVAHEHDGPASRSQVEREEPRARESEREREHKDGLVLVLGQSVDREVAAGDDRERRRQAVHVVEEVERVRDPDEPEEADRPCEDVVADDLHVQAAREDDDRGGDLRRELRDRAQMAEVVDEPGDEDDRDARQDPASSPLHSTAPIASAKRIPPMKPAKMPTPPNVGVGCSCQRSSDGTATRRPPSGERRSIQRTANVTGSAAIATIASTARKG